MSRLSISRNGLELAQSGLRRPMATVGRSPSCDVVLRAPGVEAVHFLLEWVGSGTFLPIDGKWAVFDVSATADAQSGEGVVLGESGVDFKGFHFELVESRLDSEAEIGGVISEQLGAVVPARMKLNTQAPLPQLEVVTIRGDTGTIEQLQHLRAPRWNRPRRILRDHPEFRVHWPQGGDSGGRRLEILLEEMPGAKIFRRGLPVAARDRVALGLGDLLEVRWKERSFFLRFVPPPKNIPKSKAKFEPALLAVWLASLAFSLFGVYSWLESSRQPDEPTAPVVLRIARLELPAPVQVIPVPPPAPAENVVTGKADLTPPKPSAQAPKKDPGAPAASRVRSAQKVKRTGLNSHAAVKDVNSVGLLGALAKAPAGKLETGVNPDQLLQSQIVSKTLEGDTVPKITLTQPPQGLVGMARKAESKSNEKSQLNEASTTLQAGLAADPTSAGPIASAGAHAGQTAGSLLGAKGAGDSGTETIGSIDAGGFVARGGLDKETVRRVIAGFRAEIRACYDRALLSTPKLSGRISYLWNISAAGNVTTANTQKNDIGSPVLESCVRQLILGMRFPKAANGQDTRVIYPFIFQAKSS